MQSCLSFSILLECLHPFAVATTVGKFWLRTIDPYLRQTIDWKQTEERESRKAVAESFHVDYFKFSGRARMKLGASFRFSLIRNHIEEPPHDQF